MKRKKLEMADEETTTCKLALFSAFFEEEKSFGHIRNEMPKASQVNFEAGVSRVLVIGKAGIGKTSAMKGELVTGSVKKAKGARSGAKAGTIAVETAEKVQIWGTSTPVYIIDTPGMFQTSMIKNFMKGASTKTDYVLMCVDASNRITLENALQEVFAKTTISEFNDNKRFGVLFLRMNVGEMFAETSGEPFSEEIIRKSFVEQMKMMLGDNYKERNILFYSYGSEEASTKRGKEHWAKEFAKWVSGQTFNTTLEINTKDIEANPHKFLKKVVNQVEPEYQKEAEEMLTNSFWSTWCSIL